MCCIWLVCCASNRLLVVPFCIGYDITLRRLGEQPFAGIPSKSYNQSGLTTIIDRERVVQTRVDLLYKTKGKV